MTRLLSRIACAAALACATVAHAASSVLIDYSDFWWNASESGWGAHVTLQDDVVFLVLYVYDADHRARFFVASDMRTENAASPEPLYRGSLYRTQGSPTAGTYDPARYKATAVGEASLRFTAPGSATLTYSVDGVSVTKAITRQAYGPIDLTGKYRGGTFVNTNACNSGAGLPQILYSGSLEVAQSANAVTIETRFEANFAQGGHCVLRGTLVQTGSLATIAGGTYDCEFDVGSTPLSGTFEITAIESGESGWFGRYRGTEAGSPLCSHVGRIGGTRQGFSDPPPQVSDNGM